MKKELFWNLYLPMAIGVAFLAYIVIRAAILPITHDESNTCLTFSVTSIWDIITYQDPIPNNHIVNTLLVKLFTSVFGMHAFVARLPNILGFILYFSVILIWLRKLCKKPLFILSGIVLFTCNPYLIDFFSLARGYALSISFMITSCYFTWKYLTGFNLRHYLLALIWGAVAVYTNFTILNFYAALNILLLIVNYQHYHHANRKGLYKSLRQFFIVTALLALLSFYPIYRMISTDQFHYWGSTGFYTDTILTLTKSMAYGGDYFNYPPSVWAQILIYLFMTMLLFAWRELHQNKFRMTTSPFSFFVILFTGTIFVNVLQFYLLNIPWLTTRTALFYYPLMMVALLFSFLHLYQKWRTGFRIASGIVICTGLFHMISSINTKSFFEWTYDAHTFEVLNIIKEKETEQNKPVSLDVFWQYYPSISFHVREKKYGSIQVRDFHFDIDSLSTSDYYYLERKDFPLIRNKFDEVKRFHNGEIVLAKRKTIF